MAGPIKKLSVIIPFFNDSYDVLIQGINRISKFLNSEEIPFEIIISQNGALKKIKSPFSFTKIVFDKDKGLGRAIKNALKVASGDYFYINSIDAPFNFSDLKQMLKQYDQSDLIIGSKLHPDSVYKINFIRNIFSRFISKISSLLLSKFNVKDANGSLFGDLHKLCKMSKETLSNDFFICTELVYLFFKYNYKVIEIPVEYIKINNKSSVKIEDGIKYIFKLLRLSIKERFTLKSHQS